MATDSAMQRRLMDLFKERLEVHVPSAETDLMAMGLMDSLLFVELLVQIEQEFGITIAMENLELDQFRSVASIARFLEQVQAAA